MEDYENLQAEIAELKELEIKIRRFGTEEQLKDVLELKEIYEKLVKIKVN